MEKEQYRRTGAGREKRPRFAAMLLILCIIQIFLSLATYMLSYAATPLLLVAGTGALVFTVLAVLGWDRMKPLRVVARAVGALAIGGWLAFAVFSVIYDCVNNAAGVTADTVGYYISLYGTLMAMYGQVILVMALPVAVMAASYGGKLDLWILHSLALLNSACIFYFIFYGVPVVGLFHMSVEPFWMQMGYAVFSLVIALLTFIPALHGRSVRSLRTPQL